MSPRVAYFYVLKFLLDELKSSQRRKTLVGTISERKSVPQKGNCCLCTSPQVICSPVGNDHFCHERHLVDVLIANPVEEAAYAGSPAAFVSHRERGVGECGVG
jgi:hypothetical protein